MSALLKKTSSSGINKAGSTIVEVIVALTIFATFIVGAAKVMTTQRQLTDKARAHYTAINIAKNRIEYLRNMRRASYDQIVGMVETDQRVDKNGDPISTGKFSRTTQISTTSVSGLLEIQVTVKIKNPITLTFNTEKEFLTSYMAKLL